MPRFFGPLALLVALSTACPTEGGDDDDTPREIEAPAGCSIVAQVTAPFSFELHIGGEDYDEDSIHLLMKEFEVSVFPFSFPGGIVKEFGPVEDSRDWALRIEEPPPEEIPEDWDPAWLRITYDLPEGYRVPTALDASLFAEIVMDIRTGTLVHGFRLHDWVDDALGPLLLLAEPSDLGMVYAPSETHPAFSRIEPRDRQCPTLRENRCANLYNLSMQFTVRPEQPGGPEGASFELYPTETADFDLLGSTYRAVNLWSYTHRDISSDASCAGSFNWQAERTSFFVIRADGAPD